MKNEWSKIQKSVHLTRQCYSKRGQREWWLEQKGSGRARRKVRAGLDKKFRSSDLECLDALASYHKHEGLN